MSRKTITQPYAEFEEALIVADALKPFIDGSKEKDGEFDDMIFVASNLCWRIVKTPANPANPIPEMLLKIAAAGWSGAWLTNVPH